MRTRSNLEKIEKTSWPCAATGERDPSEVELAVITATITVAA
jgi:hypothetical protein